MTQVVLTEREREIIGALPVTSLPIGVTAMNALANAKVETIDDLVQRDRRGLRRLKNLGARSLQRIEAALAEVGLHIKPSPLDKQPIAVEVLARLRAKAQPTHANDDDKGGD